jgi:hypothetical protein
MLSAVPHARCAAEGRRDTASRSRGLMRPRFAGNFLALRSEGAGNAGRPMRPIAACAGVVVERTRVSQVTPENARHSPRNGFNGFLRALPGDRAFLPPSSLRSLLLKNLMPASGHQDHTTSPSASAPFVIGASASTASRPAAVTIACRPSVGRDREGYRSDLGFRKTRIFLQRGLDRKVTDLPVRRQTAGLGCFAKPIAVIQNMIGVASAFAR